MPVCLAVCLPVWQCVWLFVRLPVCLFLLFYRNVQLKRKKKKKKKSTVKKGNKREKREKKVDADKQNNCISVKKDSDLVLFDLVETRLSMVFETVWRQLSEYIFSPCN